MRGTSALHHVDVVGVCMRAAELAVFSQDSKLTLSVSTVRQPVSIWSIAQAEVFNTALASAVVDAARLLAPSQSTCKPVCMQPPTLADT